MGPVETYRFLMDEISDPRVRNWFLMGSPLPIITIVAAYLGFVLNFGPRLMERRKPYSLHSFMICYNIFVAISSGIIFYGILTSGFTTNISLGCEPVDFSYSPEPLNMARWVWWLLLLKIVELGDTVVFVLRKKYSQASFLHVYHHVATVALSWIACKYVPGGMWTFVMLPNCLVHVIMYTYYLLACMGPTTQKLVAPYKSYLTLLQLIQFVIMVVHTAQTLMPSCEPNRKPLAFIWMFNVVVIFYMFWDFYKKSYCKKSQ
ncbi:elongation of very long chain fatty acids protein 1-like [Athalia rosae]|uniref:elongation of very long chain fatty acids protein 1-like n=1 Tax=Athalia rosae TaxID=37344 RepID=UPI0006263C77|nr:elongation of very long chain fatty acids protein 1-like [Athalia rosae]